MIDILPRKASPILKRKINPIIKKLMVTPFFLKKLINGLIIVLINHAVNPAALKFS